MKTMNVLVGYESSGVVRSAFRALGHDAWSCDFLDAEDGSRYHLKCNVFSVARSACWDMGIFHPPCTYLAGSAAWAFGDGPYHQKVKPGTLVGQPRRDARAQSIMEIEQILDFPYPLAIENPRGFISTMIRKPDQTIQPYEFGDDASKATCLWLKALPWLIPTNRIRGRMVGGKERWANQTDNGQNKLTPSPDRWKLRAKSYKGISLAMAQQWGSL